MAMNMQVRDVMTRSVISVTARQPVLDAVQLMLDNRISGLPVLDPAGKLVGIVTRATFFAAARLAPRGSGRNGWNFCSVPGGSPPNTCTAPGERSTK